jgi:ABC-type uncharacterized transport system ATPase subunit
VVLDVADLTVTDHRPGLGERHVLQVRAGEILGVAGVQGNGQTELCEALMGLRPTVAGQVTLNGRDLTHATPPGSGCAPASPTCPRTGRKTG